MYQMRLIAYLMMLSLASCQSGPSQTDPCSQFHAIYLDKQDVLTPETGREILEHNETGRILCGWSEAQ